MKPLYQTLIVLFSLLLGICTLSSCADKNDDIPQEPEEKGQFKIVFSSAASKAFFEDATAGEECEKTLKKLTMFVYKNSADAYVYQRDFSAHEINKKSAIFSISDIELTENYDFYVVANFAIKAADISGGDVTKVSRTDLLAVLQKDIANYNSPTFAGMFDNGVAKAMRTDGFVMSGVQMNVAPPTGDAPRTVAVALDRVVAKVAMRTQLSDAFKANYIEKYGSTMKIISATLSGLPLDVRLVAESSTFTTPGNFTTTFTQIPLLANDAYDNLFYTYPNGKVVGDVSGKEPKLEIIGKYDFDGKPETIDDISTITYTTELKSASGTNGFLPRNGYIKVVVNINGLTPSEVKAEIKVNAWLGVITETINFGG